MTIPPERRVFDVYGRRDKQHGFDLPVLIPRLYLHYDPYTARTRGTEHQPLARQRMDFPLLFGDRRRVVLDIDGQQHYANPDGTASPSRYAEMVAEDRRPPPAGYEVDRCGGKEPRAPDTEDMVAAFFNELHQRRQGPRDPYFRSSGGTRVPVVGHLRRCSVNIGQSRRPLFQEREPIPPRASTVPNTDAEKTDLGAHPP